MDGDRKKRKIDTEPVAEQEEEESEEEKMERFFALIRSTREARDRLRGGGLSSAEESEKSREDRRKAEEDRPRPRESAWNPTFRPEDFSQDPVLYKSSTTSGAPDVPSSSGHEAQAGPSKSKQEDKGKDDDDKKETEKDGDGGDGDDGGGLNLKLSL